MFKRKLRLCGQVLLLIVFLGGCWDANEPDKMVYVQGLGIDYQDGKYHLYLQLMDFSTLAKVDSPGQSSGEGVSEIGFASGVSFDDAIFKLYKISQRRIHFGHLNSIFLTKDALNQNGLQEVADLFDRFFLTHYRMWIYSTEDSPEDILSIDPPLQMSPYFSRLANPEESFEQASYIRPIDMRETIILNNEPPYEIFIPYVRRNIGRWKKDEKSKEMGIIDGVSIIFNDKYQGSLTGEDAAGLKWIAKEFNRMGITLKTGEDSTAGLTVKKRKVWIEPVNINGEPQFDIHIKVKAVINKLNRYENIEELAISAEKKIAAEVKRTYLSALKLNSDIYRLSGILYRKHFSVWKKIQKNGKIPLEKDSIRKINVEVEIMDSGNHWKTPTL